MTECPDNILMWSHYANNHKGICLEFATAVDPIFSDARPVEYSDTCPVYECFSQNRGEIAKRALFRKAEDWQYEKEWRIIGTRKAGTTRCFQLGTISGVIVGARIAETDLASIRKWREQLSPPPALFHAELKVGSYELEIIREPS
jgi:hypothetical protein